MIKKHKEGLWAVIVTMMLQDEADKTKFVLRDFCVNLKAHTRDGAEWEAVKMIWQDAVQKKVLQPIVGVTGMTVEDYEKAVAITKAQIAEKAAEVPQGEAPIVPMIPDADNVG